MLKISTAAAQQIGKLLLEEKDPSQSFLRVQVIGGGCSGMTYKLKFDASLDTTKDKVFEDHGVRVVTDTKSYLYLAGTELDFSGGLNGKGFTFNNPNAKKSCGCGTSFSV